MIQRYGPNENGRDFVVGDLHGCYTVLMEHLEKVGFNPETDRLFSCGDLVDRGKENHKILKLTDEPWFIPVAGNHEAMMFEGMLSYGDWPRHWQKNQGKWARREYYGGGMPFDELKDFIRQLDKKIPLAIELDHTNGKRYGIVHAAVPGYKWENVATNPEFAIWDRHILYSGDERHVEGVDYVFHGHTFIGTAQPLIIGNRVYLDTSVWETKALHIHEIGTEDQLDPNLIRRYTSW